MTPVPSRVLVAEDHDLVRRLLVRTAARLGVGVDATADGEAACTALLAVRYHVLVLDLSLPKRDGLAVLRWMQGASLAWPAPQVLVVSVAAEDKRPALLELGVTAVLAKPAPVADIAAVLAGLLPGR